MVWCGVYIRLNSSTSARMMRRLGPVPLTCDKSIPFSAATFFASGEATTLPLSAAGFGAGAAGAGVGAAGAAGAGAAGAAGFGAAAAGAAAP